MIELDEIFEDDVSVDFVRTLKSAVIVDDITELAVYFKGLKAAGIKSFKAEWRARPELLGDTVRHIRSVWLNQEAVTLFEADSAEQLLSSLPQAYLNEPEAFVDFLESVFHGERLCETFHTQHTAKGNVLDLYVVSSVTDFQDRMLSICVFYDAARFRNQQRDSVLRQRYAEALRGTQLGVWDLRVDADECRFGADYYGLLGYAPDEFEHGPWKETSLIHPADRHLFPTNVVDGRLEREFRFRHRDGHYIWLHEVGAITETDESGKPIRAVGTARDITGQKRRAVLGELERTIFQAAVEGTTERELLMLVSRGVDRAYENHQSIALLLDEKREAVACAGSRSVPDFADSLVGFRIHSVDSSCRQAIRNLSFSQVEDIHRDDQYVEIAKAFTSVGVRSMGSMPIINSRGIAMGTICLTSSDASKKPPGELMELERVARTLALVVEEKRQAARRESLERQLRNHDKFESLGKLAGGIAHDFNNLLVTIMANAELCQLMSADAPAVVESADQILHASRMAASLCEQMLTYAGRIDSNRQPLDPARVINNVCGLIRSSLPSAQIQLTVDCDPDVPFIQANETAMSQIVLNLVTNASEAIGENGTISVESRVANVSREEIDDCVFGDHLDPGRHVILAISDNGKGIRAEDAKRVFDPFFTTKTTGRGLGLATVLGLVEQHRAAIRLDSREDSGTTVRVYFPCSTEEPVAARSERTAQHPSRRILVVDDQDSVRESVCKILEEASNTAVAVESGNKAIELIRSGEHFDLVLLDQQMPGLSGLETYRQIREINRDISICFMTGFSASQELESVIRIDSGTNLLRKPFVQRQILGAIHRVQDRTDGI